MQRDETTVKINSNELDCAFPHCPFCGNACTIIYHNLAGAPFACEKCVQRISSWNEALMLKWDNDSPVAFHADGHTVHDFELRFQMEDDGLISADDKVFRWDMLETELNYRWF